MAGSGVVRLRCWRADERRLVSNERDSQTDQVDATSYFQDHEGDFRCRDQNTEPRQAYRDEQE